MYWWICTWTDIFTCSSAPILFTDTLPLIFQYVDHRYIANLLPSVGLDTCTADTAIRLMPN